MDTTILAEARNVVKSSMQRIDNRVLSRSAELKTRVVSIASRIYDLLNYLDLILGGVEERVSREEKERKTYDNQLSLPYSRNPRLQLPKDRTNCRHGDLLSSFSCNAIDLSSV